MVLFHTEIKSESGAQNSVLVTTAATGVVIIYARQHLFRRQRFLVETDLHEVESIIPFRSGDSETSIDD